MRRRMIWMLVVIAIIVGAGCTPGMCWQRRPRGSWAPHSQSGDSVTSTSSTTCSAKLLAVQAQERLLAVPAEDQGTLGPLRPEQRLGAWGEHRLAHSPRAQPDRRHRRGRDCVRRRRSILYTPRLFGSAGFSKQVRRSRRRSRTPGAQRGSRRCRGGDRRAAHPDDRGETNRCRADWQLPGECELKGWSAGRGDGRRTVALENIAGLERTITSRRYTA